MIIIGSFAAWLGGFYPTWRDHNPKDIDLVCHADEIPSLNLGTIVPTVAGRYRSFFAMNKFDISVVNGEVYGLLTHLSPAPQLVELGDLNLMAQVAPPSVVLATLYLTAGCVPSNFDKSFRDLIHYRSLVNVSTFDDDHWTLAKGYRAMMIEHISGTINN